MVGILFLLTALPGIFLRIGNKKEQSEFLQKAGLSSRRIRIVIEVILVIVLFLVIVIICLKLGEVSDLLFTVDLPYLCLILRRQAVIESFNIVF